MLKSADTRPISKDTEMTRSALDRIRSKWQLDKKNGWIAGVCAGLANFFHTDPAFVRVAAIVAALFMPKIAIAAYLIIWLLLDDRRA